MADPLDTADRSKYRKWTSADEDEFQDFGSSKNFWYRLLCKAPPPQDVNLQQMINLAAKIQLTIQLSNTPHARLDAPPPRVRLIYVHSAPSLTKEL